MCDPTIDIYLYTLFRSSYNTLAGLYALVLATPHAFTLCSFIGIGAGPAGQVLAGPLLFKLKIKFHFCKKQVMNRSTSVIFRLVRLIILLYNR